MTKEVQAKLKDRQEEIFAINTINKGVASIIYKELLQINNKRQYNLQKWSISN